MMFIEEQALRAALSTDRAEVARLVATMTQREQDDLETACDLISEVIGEVRE